MCCSVIGVGQTSGRFYLEKPVYARGEPIFVYFQVVNDGSKAETFDSVDPYSPCSGYQFSVSSDRPHPSCGPSGPRGISISCGVSSVVLLPGEKRIERVLLNFGHKVDTPGQYTVQAARGGLFPREFKDTLEVHSALHFQVSENAAKAKVFQRWVDQLRSTDGTKRLEAARTLASLAPPSLEDTLLTFAGDPWIQQFAPLALHRLNTPRSMAALAEFLAKTEPGTWEHQKAADYLARDQCGDEF